MSPRRLPLPARLLVRLSPVPRESRAEVEGDIHELFTERRGARGMLHAHWRLYRDLASLWRRRDAAVAAPARSPLALLGDAAADLRFAARLFARQPAILLLATLGLSIGLGIATAAFTIMNAAVLRGEGLADSDRTPGIIRTTRRATATTWRYDEFLHLQAGATRIQVEALVSDSAKVRTIAGQGDTPSAAVAFVSAGFFEATGARLHAGRALSAGDEHSPIAFPVVASFAFWKTRLDGDPSAIGRSIRVGHADATIVGIASRGFSLPSSRELWMPLTAYGAVYSPAAATRAPEAGIQLFGRLRPDAGMTEAAAQLSAVAATLPTSASNDPLSVRLDTRAGLGRVSAGDAIGVAVTVFAVIALVLLLACGNVATVLLATAITREREIGVRAALGASRGRIVRQLITESLAIGTLAAVVGLVFVYWSIPALRRLIEIPTGTDLVPDFTVFGFLGLVTLFTGVVAGLAPALHGRGSDLVTALKGAPARNRVAPRRLRSLLIGTQAAVSILLVAVSTFFVRASSEAATLDVGFRPEGLYVLSPGPALREESGATIRSFYDRALPAIEGISGLGSAALAEITPFSGAIKTSMQRDGTVIYLNRTQPEYFEAMGLATVTGRVFTRDELRAQTPVAVISQSMARRYWPDRSPIGERIDAGIPMGGARPLVVGVVADAIGDRPDQQNTLAIYQPLDPTSLAFADLLVRAEPGATGVIQQVLQRLRAVDPQLEIRVTSIEALLRQETRRPRTMAMMTGAIGLFALVLCVIGLYGLTASLAGQREREMCVRVAIGASPRDLLRLVMWDSLRPVVVGLGIGTLVALGVGRLLGSVVFFGVTPQDPAGIAVTLAVLLAATGVAVLLPTRRAIKVNPVAVLRG